MTLSYLQLCISQMNDISRECNVNRSGGNVGKTEDNSNDNFDLPEEIDINLGQLRGGPFNYGNITMTRYLTCTQLINNKLQQHERNSKVIKAKKSRKTG